MLENLITSITFYALTVSVRAINIHSECAVVSFLLSLIRYLLFVLKAYAKIELLNN